MISDGIGETAWRDPYRSVVSYKKTVCGKILQTVFFGRDSRTRTYDLLHVKQAL